MALMQANGAVATTSMLFIVFAVALGFYLKYTKLNKWVNTAVAVAFLIISVAAGLAMPVYIPQGAWLIFVFIYVI